MLQWALLSIRIGLYFVFDDGNDAQRVYSTYARMQLILMNTAYKSQLIVNLVTKFEFIICKEL